MSTTSTVTLTARIRQRAHDLGFDLVGITDVRPSEHAAFLQQWLGAEYHGQMEYLAREDAVGQRVDPARAWPTLRSAVVVALSYWADAGVAQSAAGAAGDAGRAQTDPAKGVIARYARGRDYHKVMKRKLLDLLRWIETETGRELPAARAYADTGPVLERELARRAGLGWFGRNTMLIHPRRGSYFFLGSLLLELELEADVPFSEVHCGTCNSCVSACPTGALLGRDENGAPVMDARRCISYLTIESRGPIPLELRPLIGNRIYGCDICQEVCPFSRKFSRPTSEPAFACRGPGEPPFGVEKLPSDGWHPGTRAPSLVDLMSMDEAGWEAFSRGSPMRRAGYPGFLRNVAVALGNWGSSEGVSVLAAALNHDQPLVRGHAAWALGEIGTTDAVHALAASLAGEREPFVRVELKGALDRLRVKGQSTASDVAQSDKQMLDPLWK